MITHLNCTPSPEFTSPWIFHGQFLFFLFVMEFLAMLIVLFPIKNSVGLIVVLIYYDLKNPSSCSYLVDFIVSGGNWLVFLRLSTHSMLPRL